ncbi:MAG: HNH endonuclease [Candidatus Helarchaeota archaeon]
MCAKHTSRKKWRPQKYPQRRKKFSQLTIKKLNKILYCQNLVRKNRKCGKYIPVGSPERQKHHIIPLSRGGTNNAQNILVCCIDCHYELHREEFTQRGITLEAFRRKIYMEYHSRTTRPPFHSNVGRRGLGGRSPSPPSVTPFPDSPLTTFIIPLKSH